MHFQKIDLYTTHDPTPTRQQLESIRDAFAAKYPKIANIARARLERAISMCLDGMVERKNDWLFSVKSQSNPMGEYQINIVDKTCTCPDSGRLPAHVPCKHRAAVHFWIETAEKNQSGRTWTALEPGDRIKVNFMRPGIDPRHLQHNVRAYTLVVLASTPEYTVVKGDRIFADPLRPMSPTRTAVLQTTYLHDTNCLLEIRRPVNVNQVTPPEKEESRQDQILAELGF